MKKKLALWIGLVAFCMTISDPLGVAFACHGGRARAGRGGSMAAASGGVASAPAPSRGFTTYARPSPDAPWRSTGYYSSFDDAVRAMQNAQSQGMESFVRQ